MDIPTAKASVTMKEGKFQDVMFTESDLAPEHDVVFGLPWFRQFNPKVNWEAHEFTVDGHQSTPVANEESEVPSSTTEQQRVAGRNRLRNGLHLTEARRQSVFHSSTKATRRLDDNRFAEILMVKVSAVMEMKEVPEYLEPLVKEFYHVCPERLPEGLPLERRVQVQVEMKPESMPSSRAPFRLSKTEQEALDVFINENLKKGWIEVSNSPWVSNIFGIPKKGPGTGLIPKRAEWLRSGNSAMPIRWVIDYRYVNSQTKIPLPSIEELFDEMAGYTVFTIIDLAQGYHQMLVEKQSRQYTAFRSHKETYQWCVASMGLAGMPGIWSRLMRVLFDKFEFVVVYSDDICVFSKTREEHVMHLRQVIEVSEHEKLYAHRAKCSFGKASVDFLGHTVSSNGLSVDKRKTAAIEAYPEPMSRKELQSFLGLAGEQRSAFQTLKLALQQAPVLMLLDFAKKFTVTTDAFGFSHLSDATKARFQAGYRKDPEFAPAWKSVRGNEKYEKKNGLICVRTKHSVSPLCVPDVVQLITNILHEFHDGSASAHPGIRRTQLKVAQWYYWPTLEKDVRAYVLSCSTCARWKSNSSKKNGKIMPIPVPNECWEVVSTDFVVDQLVAKGFDAIMTVVDKLSKRPKYAPTHIMADADEVARLFFETVMSPFEIDTGRKVSNIIAQHQDNNEVPLAEFAKKFAQDRQKLIELARQNLIDAQECQKQYYDRKRREATFMADCLVMLDTKNIPLKHVTKGVNLKQAKLLALPRYLKRLHPSFNIELSSHYVPNSSKFGNRPIPKATPVVLEEDTGEELHIVESLLKKRMFNRKPEWLVKWHGLPAHECTWERERDIKHVSHWQDLLQDFKHRQREVNSVGM
ncbi:Retroelement pol polyprotein, partial [Globisporangium splendens]